MQKRARIVFSKVYSTGIPVPPLVEVLVVAVLVCLWPWAVVRVEGCSRTPPLGTDCSTQVDCHMREEEGSGRMELELPHDK